ncbi:MAG: glycosyltransferase [Betaproteobacteria bacterium]|nr:MAG: glycosyltransferase [Betaproteobacteria bacterium]
MTRRVQVVEPTLENFAGHCYSLVASLCRATDVAMDIWAARGAESFDFRAECLVHPFFRRRVRLFQQLGLYRRLIREDDPIVITTARRSDLILLNLIAPGRLLQNRVFLYFHWFRESPKRFRFLQKIAAHQPNLVIFGTTASVVDLFQRAGFRYVDLLPYPAPPAAERDGDVAFRRLLYAGAARRDKGFRQVVDLVALLADRGERIPIAVQVSPEHFGKYDMGTIEDIKRLRGIGYAHLELLNRTLAPEEYAALFSGSICLQPYDRADFRDRVSGVTLDALARGCPVITTAGTWMAAQIESPKAGIALESVTAESLLDAAKAILGSYAGFRTSALEAAWARNRETWTPLTRLLDL